MLISAISMPGKEPPNILIMQGISYWQRFLVGFAWNLCRNIFLSSWLEPDRQAMPSSPQAFAGINRMVDVSGLFPRIASQAIFPEIRRHGDLTRVLPFLNPLTGAVGARVVLLDRGPGKQRPSHLRTTTRRISTPFPQGP